MLGIDADDTVPSRIYFHCGEVIVAVDRRPEPDGPSSRHPTTCTSRPASSTRCTHGRSAAGARDVSPVETQPWGERSFYCLDLDGNRLCFVDETTLFLGRGAAWS